jgi:very-short-patch-repair endonuclease
VWQWRSAAGSLRIGMASFVGSWMQTRTGLMTGWNKLERRGKHEPDDFPGTPHHCNHTATAGMSRHGSASEAFLFRRLQTLPATAGRFRLNVKLPIPFDGAGEMEVDLLCAQTGIVVELDGAQHLADAEAYRRDRRKDALLQRNGYFILRFLAEDAGKHLDDGLDTMLATLVHRERIKKH